MVRPIEVLLVALFFSMAYPASPRAQLHIHHINVQADTLFIQGRFGNVRGIVIVDGQEKQPAFWSDSLITYNATKGYSFCVATPSDTSNTRWLTRWQVGMSCSIAYVKHPNDWIGIGFTKDIVGDISSYLLEPDMPVVAQFQGLSITPGDWYRFDDNTLALSAVDKSLLEPGAVQDIDPKQPPWYYVKDVNGGLYQHDPPPDSVMRTRRFISHRSPAHGSKILPEFRLEISWRPKENFERYQLQIRNEANKPVIDTQLANSSYVMTSVEPRSTYTWRLRGVDKGDSTDWMSWWTFTTDKLDRNEPFYRVQRSVYARTITARDTGRFASGLKRIEVQANNDSEAHISPGRLVTGTCELTPRSITIQQLDTTIAIHYAVITTDCEDNTIALYDSIPAHPYQETERVSSKDTSLQSRFVQVISRGDPFTFYDIGSEARITMYDVAGNQIKIQYSLHGTIGSIFTHDLVPGLYAVVISAGNAIERSLLLIRP